MGLRSLTSRVAAVMLAAVVGTPATPRPRSFVTFTVTESRAYPIDYLHLHRSLIGGWLSRVWEGFEFDDAAIVGLDFTHQGSGANCVTWNTALAGASRLNVSLGSGTQSATAVANAVAAAFTGIGRDCEVGVASIDANGVEVCDVVIYDVVDTIDAPAFAEADTSTHRMHGRQRFAYAAGQATTLLQSTASAHVAMPATAGRVIGVALITSAGARTGTVRLGVANGPVYSTNPAAAGGFTGGVSGVASRNGDQYAFPLSEPQAYTSSANKWAVARAATADAISIETRAHAATPAGNGNLTAAERIIVDLAASTDPDDEIFTAGAYSPTASATVTSYMGITLIIEQPTAGNYRGRGNVSTIVGYQPAFNAGTPSSLGAATLRTLSDTPRYPVIGSCGTLDWVEVATTTAGGGDDFGLAIYDFSLATITAYPVTESCPRLASYGPMGIVSSGYTRYTPASPLPLPAVSRIGICNTCGGPTATTIVIPFDASQPNGVTGYIDDGVSYSDGVEAYGANHQYVCDSAGAMPFGSANPSFPSEFAQAATDTTGANGPRIRWKHSRRGISAVVTLAA